MIEYKSLLPKYYEGVKEIEALNKAVNKLIDEAETKMSDLVIEDRFFNELNLSGVQRWEKILKINSPIDSSLISRRNAVKAKVNSLPPINVKKLKEVVETYLGVSVKVDMLAEPYTSKITYRGVTDLPDLNPLLNTLYEMIPANIAVIIEYAYVKWAEIEKQTWDSLSSKTWEDVIIGDGGE